MIESAVLSSSGPDAPEAGTLVHSASRNAAFAAVLSEKASGLYDTERSNLPIARKSGASERQDRRDGAGGADPTAALDPTSAAVAELASHGPAKATVAAAEQDATAPKAPGNTGESPRPSRAEQTAMGPAKAQPDRDAASPASARGSPGAEHIGTKSETGASRETARPGPQADQDASSGSKPAGTHPSSQSTPGTRVAPVAGRIFAGPAVRPAGQGQTATGVAGTAKASKAAALPKATPKAPAAQTPSFKFELEDKLAAQAARGLVAALRQGGGSVTLRLQPEALGDLKVRVELAEGRVGASFEVQDEPARGLLHKSLSSLRSALEARGLEVDKLDVRIAERQAEAPQHGDFGGADTSGGAGTQDRSEGSPGQDRPGDGGVARMGGGRGTAGMPPDTPDEVSPALHGARSGLVILTGGDPWMRVRLDALA